LASKIKGVNLLCAHGRAGQTQLSYWGRISQSEIRKIAAAKKEAAKARAGKNSSPQPPSFLPARAFRFGSAARSAAISRDFVQNEF